MQDDTKVIDKSALQILKESLGEENFTPTLSRFIDEIEALKAESFTALDEENFELFHVQAHKLKSSIGYLGGKKLAGICARIEDLYAAEKIEEIKKIGPDFKSCCRETLDALRNI